MAVTSMWAINVRVEKAVDYVLNPDKTTERPELTPEAISARRAVGDAIDYASNADKTEKMMYVTGINCNPDTALKEFMNTKLSWGKLGGRLAYHGYQSFREGVDVLTPEKAHEIGVQLAQECWGSRYEVIVATHLNTGHLHNHFILNSVSFADGYKFHRTKADYYHMQKVSDRLCRDANLHVVADPSTARGKSYDEWSAERQGRTTIRGRIREDIDYAIKMSRCEKDFADLMKEWGYEFKFYSKNGTELVHPGIKPPGAKGYFRFSSLGENYEFETIRRRVIENSIVPGTPFLIEKNYRKWEPPQEDLYGLPRLYKKYCVRLYSYISKPAKREYIPMALREDIIKLDNYIEQMDFLYSHQIENQDSLANMKNEYQKTLKALIVQRRHLYYDKEKAIRDHDEPLLKRIKKEIQETSIEIREVKKKISLCDRVFVSAKDILSRVDAPDRKPDMPKIKNPKKNLSL